MVWYIQQLSAFKQFEASDTGFLDSNIRRDYSTQLYLRYSKMKQPFE